MGIRRLLHPVALLFCTACSVSSSGYFRYIDKDKASYEVVAEEHAQVYRAAYELCRDRHKAGYRTLLQPLPTDGWKFMGKFVCEGEFDPTLAIRYEYLDTGFVYGSTPISDRYYFRFPARTVSPQARWNKVRFNSLNEQ